VASLHSQALKQRFEHRGGLQRKKTFAFNAGFELTTHNSPKAEMRPLDHAARAERKRFSGDHKLRAFSTITKWIETSIDFEKKMCLAFLVDFFSKNPQRLVLKK
jgi:hypothetical protein